MSQDDDLTVVLQQLADAEAPWTADQVTAVAPIPPAIPPRSTVLQPGDVFDHYRIEAELGRGGMGVVYRAHDSALERTVAIKLIHQHLCDGDWDYLRRETTAVMRLQHPNIATFYDVGEHARLAWLVMEYVAGESLLDKLKRDGRFSGEELMRLAEGLLSALGHAHAAGVLHADIKPANIMLDSAGRVKLLDFGIARLMHDIGLPDDQQYTRTGTISGSPGFMAPEQLRGEKTDQRSDLFSVGAVLFQAATGESAFRGQAMAERMAAVLAHKAGDLARRLPGPLGSVLDRVTHPDREQRHATAAELLFDLRQAVDQDAGPQAPGRLLLLAPQPPADASELAWLGKALSNALRSTLDNSPHLELIAEAQVQEVGSPGASAMEIGRRLAARWAVHGSLQQQGQAVSLKVEISDVGTERCLASRRLTTPLEQLFSLQAELAQWAAEQLAVQAQPERIAPQWNELELCARGEAAFACGGKDGLAEARHYFQLALESYPESRDALAGIAGVHAMTYTFTSDSAELDKAKNYCAQALELDPGLHPARVWLIYALMRQHQPDEAMAQAEIVMQQASDSHMACYFAACCLAAEARYAEALRYFQASLRDDPSRSWTWLGAGNCHARLGHTESALWCLQRAVEVEPTGRHFTTAGCGAYLAEFLRRQGQLSQAWKAGQQALRRVEASDFIYRDTFRAYALIVLGRIALQRGQKQASTAAFNQAELGIRGRPRALGAGHLLVQAIAGRAGAEQKTELLEQAQRILEQGTDWNFEWAWGCHREDSLEAIEDTRRMARYLPPV